MIPSTAVQSALHQVISSRVGDVKVVNVARKYFSESCGAVKIRQLGCNKIDDTELRDKYLAVGSGAALVKYVEFIQHVLFPAGSLRVEFKGTEGSVVIDRSTIKCLELVSNVKGTKVNTLLEVLNYTLTPGGCMNEFSP